jgi:hypothetical protein
MGENQACQSQVHVTVLRCLRVKPRKKGLNRRLKPVLQGGGLVLTHYLITWLGKGWSTRHSWRVITLRPGTLLEFILFFTWSSTPNKNVHYYFYHYWLYKKQSASLLWYGHLSITQGKCYVFCAQCRLAGLCYNTVSATGSNTAWRCRMYYSIVHSISAWNLLSYTYKEFRGILGDIWYFKYWYYHTGFETNILSHTKSSPNHSRISCPCQRTSACAKPMFILFNMKISINLNINWKWV